MSLVTSRAIFDPYFGFKFKEFFLNQNNVEFDFSIGHTYIFLTIVFENFLHSILTAVSIRSITAR